MPTRTRSAEQAVEAVRRALAGPLHVSIEGAQAYWLEDRSGRCLSQEAVRTEAPFALALVLVQSGTDPDDLSVWARLSDGERYRVASGVALVDMAEGAAGLPRRPRDPRAG